MLSAALTARFDGAVGPEVSKGSASIIILFIDFLDNPIGSVYSVKPFARVNQCITFKSSWWFCDASGEFMPVFCR